MERLILPPKFLVELRMLPESKLNQSHALIERWLGYYSGVDVILKSRQHSDICRVQLTQNLRKCKILMPSLEPSTKTDRYILAEFMPDMAEELSFAMAEALKHCTSQGQSIHTVNQTW